MKKYEKYLMCNLGYMDNKLIQHSLVLMRISKWKNLTCNHCNKIIKGNVYHFNEYKTYSHEDYGIDSEWTDKEWTFDYKCMSIVVGVGLG